MRYLIVSDLHAIRVGLIAVLQHAAGRYDQAVCCGDLVGYGADPNYIVDWVRANCAVTVRGNHDRACTGIEDLEWFNPVAKQAALWTQSALTPENVEWTRNLPKGPLIHDGLQLIHGSPFDEDEYVMAPEEAGNSFGYLETRLAFFGFLFVLGGFFWNHNRVEKIMRTSPRSEHQLLEIDPDCAYLVNPGSTGQPRDGDPRAAYVIYDSGASMLTYYRTLYDIAGAQKRIRAAGLPTILAERLSVGR